MCNALMLSQKRNGNLGSGKLMSHKRNIGQVNFAKVAILEWCFAPIQGHAIDSCFLEDREIQLLPR